MHSASFLSAYRCKQAHVHEYPSLVSALIKKKIAFEKLFDYSYHYHLTSISVYNKIYGNNPRPRMYLYFCSQLLFFPFCNFLCIYC